MPLTNQNNMKSNKQFVSDIEAGNAWEFALHSELAQYLHGITKPSEITKVDGMYPGGFGYEPDMTITSSLEAKVRLAKNFTFTSAIDYPFDSIFVNEVYKTCQRNMEVKDYLRLSQQEQLVYMKPFHSYWIASADMSHVAVISPATKPCWFQREVYSAKDRRPALNWCCPLKTDSGRPVVLFGKFPDDVPQLLTRL